MVLEAKIKAEQNRSVGRQFIDQHPARFVKPINDELKNITVSRQVVLKAMSETSVLVSRKKVGVVEAVLHENVARGHACMMAKRVVEVYVWCPFYFTIPNFGNVDVHPTNSEKVDEVDSVPVEIVHVRDEFLYPSEAHANKSESSVNAVRYKQTQDRLKRWKIIKQSSRRKRRTSRSISMNTFSYPSRLKPTDRLSWKCSKTSRLCRTGI